MSCEFVKTRKAGFLAPEVVGVARLAFEVVGDYRSNRV